MFSVIYKLYSSKMSGIETQKRIKPIFSDKSDKSKSFVQIYDVETGTFVIKIYNFVSENFFKFAFKNVFDENRRDFI